MGIKGLMALIGDCAPGCFKEDVIKNYFGRKVAIDASMSLYSFMVAVRMEGGNLLTNEAGETTSYARVLRHSNEPFAGISKECFIEPSAWLVHLLLSFGSCLIGWSEHGIKPVWIFDGKPPVLKSGELARRSQKKAEATEALKAAEEEGNADEVAKMTKRSVHVTKEHNADAKKLLRLMGMPVVEAPSEAEAQCAALTRAGKVWATATEDMDALTFGTPMLLRHLTFAETRKMPIVEVHLDKVLSGLGISMDQFIDVCILCGCDYCDTIKGIGPKRALDLIQKHGCIEEALKHLDKEKYPLPLNFNFDEIRQIFRSPEVANPETFDFKWEEPDVDGIVAFLVKEKGFSEERVMKGIERLKKSTGSSVQGRLDGFFKPAPVDPAVAAAQASAKRKRDEETQKALKAKLKSKGAKALRKGGK